MKNTVFSPKSIQPPDIEFYRLEPFIDLELNQITGYEVLSTLRDGIDAGKWFEQLSGEQQIELLLLQIESVADEVKEKCFFNLSVEGFLWLKKRHINRMTRCDNVCLEVSDSSALKKLNEKKRYLFFKHTAALRKGGIEIWMDDFCSDDLISLPEYKGKVDGVKIDRSEMRSVHLSNLINIVKKMLGNIPVLIEGVETLNDLALGASSGADIAQGYLWSAPDDDWRINRST
ncbi:EAL domain-containing protein [Cronobacter dublinensis]|uniref:EAL domain-containing protein n=1 Tax=Cronobacter dublinensis TaxID=413497 RepID=UPI0024AEC459|nr:EAL domain-containing protein [Cronobacter dublinensis]MDI7383112.1 EAL domain-containing protein [Cronobacter dublinensis]